MATMNASGCAWCWLVMHLVRAVPGSGNPLCDLHKAIYAGLLSAGDPAGPRPALPPALVDAINRAFGAVGFTPVKQ